jgi:hypothetical protein
MEEHIMYLEVHKPCILLIFDRVIVVLGVAQLYIADEVLWKNSLPGN